MPLATTEPLRSSSTVAFAMAPLMLNCRFVSLVRLSVSLTPVSLVARRSGAFGIGAASTDPMSTTEPHWPGGAALIRRDRRIVITASVCHQHAIITGIAHRTSR